MNKQNERTHRENKGKRRFVATYHLGQHCTASRPQKRHVEAVRVASSLVGQTVELADGELRPFVVVPRIPSPNFSRYLGNGTA